MAYQIYPQASQEPARGRPAPMLEEFAALDAAIESLAKHCEILEERLQSVLFPVDRENAVPSNVPSNVPEPRRGPTVQLANEVRSRRERIELLTSHVVSMHERVGV